MLSAKGNGPMRTKGKKKGLSLTTTRQRNQISRKSGAKVEEAETPALVRKRGQNGVTKQRSELTYNNESDIERKQQ